jgi:ABC-type polysaccharide/polyol phosphate transport system ATPase subunit
MDAIFIDKVTKTYRLGVGRARVREMLPSPLDRGVKTLFPRWWSRDTFNALEEVSISIQSGSSVGIVGHNGAGKTTLLKVIAGVTDPTAGRVTVNGRVAALIDVLIGFHPDLTGRENIFLLGAIYGFGRRSMSTRVDRILEFAEINELADTPLKRFSAGMIARLGFSIITVLDVEGLLIDEVLAVGDAGFQRKCIRWLDMYSANGGTLMFVSHNLGLVRNMTERVIWLDHGRVASDGPTAETLSQYARAMEHRSGATPAHRAANVRKIMREHGHDRWGAGGVRVEEVRVGEVPSDGEALRVAISYESAAEVERAIFCLGFVDEHGREVGAAASPPLPLVATGGSVECHMEPLPLRSGIYFPVVAILSPEGLVRDRWQLERAVVVDREGETPMPDLGPIEIHSRWNDLRGAGQ